MPEWMYDKVPHDEHEKEQEESDLVGKPTVKTLRKKRKPWTFAAIGLLTLSIAYSL